MAFIITGENINNYERSPILARSVINNIASEISTRYVETIAHFVESLLFSYQKPKLIKTVHRTNKHNKKSNWFSILGRNNSYAIYFKNYKKNMKIFSSNIVKLLQYNNFKQNSNFQLTKHNIVNIYTAGRASIVVYILRAQRKHSSCFRSLHCTR